MSFDLGKGGRWKEKAQDNGKEPNFRPRIRKNGWNLGLGQEDVLSEGDLTALDLAFDVTWDLLDSVEGQ